MPFVDDTLNIIDAEAADDFRSKISDVDPMIRWEFKQSDNGFDFLDLKGTIKEGRITFQTYKKPSFKQKYLHGLSDHPLNIKLSIAKSQVSRFVCNNSNEQHFQHDISQMNNVLSRSFLPPVQPSYCTAERTNVLQRFAAKREASFDSVCPVARLRSHFESRKQQTSNKLVFRVPYSKVTAALHLKQSVLQLGRSNVQFEHLEKYDVVIAYSVGVNSFRRSYACNFIARGKG